MKIFLLTSFIVGIDQITKLFATKSLYEPIWLTDGIGFQLSKNVGMAFSIPVTGVLAIIIPLILIILLLVFTVKRLDVHKSITACTISFILGGAIGNLIDRLWLGYVVDFIHIGWWPTFNLADSFVVVGCLLFVIFYDKLHRGAVSQ